MEVQPKPQALWTWLSSHWKDIIKIALALCLIGIVFSQTNFQKITALKGQIVWPWLWCSLGLFCLMTCVKALQYRALLDMTIPYRQILKIVVVQNALSNLVGNSMGVVSYLTMFRMEQNIKLSRSGIIFILTKAGDLFAIIFFLGLSSWMVWTRITVLHHLIAILMSGVLAGLVFFWTAIFLRQKFIRPLEGLLHGLHLDQNPLVGRGMGLLRYFVEQDHKTVIRAFGSSLVLSLCYMTVTMAASYSRIQILQVPLGFWPIILITSLMQLVSLIPIQVFGGLGVNEVSSYYLYGLFDMIQVDIPAILIGLRILFYLFNLAALAFMSLEGPFERMRKHTRK